MPRPSPCASGTTAYDASSQSFSRTNDTTTPRIWSSISATQQPPGSVLTRCSVRAIQFAPRCGGRSSGSGSARRTIRVSSSWNPIAVTRSARGTSCTVIGRIRASPT